VDIPSLGLIEQDPVDYDGVDLLATTLLSGLSSWFDRLDWEDWTRQHGMKVLHKCFSCCGSESHFGH
jgi:hypothetical protein